MLLAVAPDPASGDPGSAALPLINQTNNPIYRQALNNLHHDMAYCAAFFEIATEGIGRRSDGAELSATYKAAAGRMMQRMLVFHNEDVSAARYKLAVEDLLGKQMKRDFVNLSLIMHWLEPCAAINKDAVQSLVDYIIKASEQ